MDEQERRELEERYSRVMSKWVPNGKEEREHLEARAERQGYYFSCNDKRWMLVKIPVEYADECGREV